MPTDRDDWKFILEEVRVLHGPHSRWREGEVLMFGMTITMNTYYVSKQNKRVHLLQWAKTASPTS